MPRCASCFSRAAGCVFLQEGEQRIDGEGVEDLGGRKGLDDVAEGLAGDVYMPALVEVEQDIAVASFREEALDRRIEVLKGLFIVEDLDLEVGGEVDAKGCRRLV